MRSRAYKIKARVLNGNIKLFFVVFCQWEGSHIWVQNKKKLLHCSLSTTSQHGGSEKLHWMECDQDPQHHIWERDRDRERELERRRAGSVAQPWTVNIAQPARGDQTAGLDYYFFPSNFSVPKSTTACKAFPFKTMQKWGNSFFFFHSIFVLFLNK